MKDEYLSDFMLAGDTNLALQIGHRESLDLDLFPNISFDSKKLEQYLKQYYNFIPQLVLEKNTIIGFIDNVKVDFIAHKYPLLYPIWIEDDIRMYSLQDIACMKLVAISDNGTRLKDFIDIAYLSTKLSLMDMLLAYKKKYDRPNYFQAAKGLSYFDDINFKTSITFSNGKHFEWKKIERRIREMIKFEDKVFETPPI
jgi:hypothetical protein